METTMLTNSSAAALNEMISLLIAEFKPLYIYQFAQMKQRGEILSIFAKPVLDVKEMYYLLLITEGTASRENEIQEFVDRNEREAYFVIHAHGEEILKRNLNYCNAYFTTVLNQGTLLYSANGKLLRTKVQGPNPEKQLLRVQAQWQRRSEMAKAFIGAAQQCLENGRDKVCIFLLHHACEQLCVGLIWVYMGYKSDIRNLRRLLHVCACFSTDPMQYFMGSDATEDLLTILMKSYRGSRYNDDFSLEGRSAYWFVEVVEGFYDLAEGLCLKRFGR